MARMRRLIGLLSLGVISEAQIGGPLGQAAGRRRGVRRRHLREWALSVRGLEKYDLPEQYRDIASSTPAYLENCPKATTPVIPAYLRFPRW